MQEDLSSGHVDPRAYLRPIWARKWYILAAVVLTTLATYAYYNHKPRQYTASASVYVKGSAIDQLISNGISFTDDQRNTANQAQLLTTPEVAREVAKKLNYKGDPRALLGGISASASTDTDFVTITAVRGTAVEAANAANVFARAFIDVRTGALRERAAAAERIAKAQLATLPATGANRRARDDLQQRIDQLSVVQSVPAGAAEVANPASPPATASYPHPGKNAVFAFFLALLFAIGAVFLVELFDRRVKTIEDIEATYPFPILAVVPRETDLAPTVEGNVTFARTLREAFRSLRTSVELSLVDREVRTIIVTSAIAGEGKSTVVRNLALAYREAGRRVAVVETDLRKPTLAKLFGVEKRPGLTDALAADADLRDAFQNVSFATASESVLTDTSTQVLTSNNGSGDGGDLRVMTSGPQPPNPPAILASERVHGFLDDLRREYDVVIIDSPPLLAVSDSVPLLPKADAILIVTRLGHTTRAAGRRLIGVLSLVPDVHVTGVVVNDLVSNRLSETGFEYYYYGPSEG